VDELIRRKLAKEAADKELEEFVDLLKSAKALPLDSKPSKNSWLMEEKVKQKIESLQAYAVDACNDAQRRMAGNVTYPIPIPSFFLTLKIYFNLVSCFVETNILLSVCADACVHGC
jgi:hypothetical protein